MLWRLAFRYDNFSFTQIGEGLIFNVYTASYIKSFQLPTVTNFIEEFAFQAFLIKECCT